MRKLDAANSDRAYKPVVSEEMSIITAQERLDSLFLTLQSVDEDRKFFQRVYDKSISDAMYLLKYFVDLKCKDIEKRDATALDIRDAVLDNVGGAIK